MAIFHFDADIIGLSSGHSAVAAAAYRAGVKIRDEQTGIVHNYSNRKDVQHAEIMLPALAPDWAKDRYLLWNMVSKSEIRYDGQLARSILLALPHELKKHQQVKLLRDFIEVCFTSKGMIADFVIHGPERDDGQNYHAHILLTLRRIAPEGFGNKEREWNDTSYVTKWRKNWEVFTNKALEKAGLDVRIDCRSHADKGIDREPMLHLGSRDMALERAGIQTQRGNENRAIEARNAQRAAMEADLGKNLDNSAEPVETFSAEEITAIKDIHPDKPSVDPAQVNRVQELFYLEALFNKPPNPSVSMGELKTELEKIKVTTESQLALLNNDIERESDNKTKSRLRMLEKLEKTRFVEFYNNSLASILIEEADSSNGYKIEACKHLIRTAQREYADVVAEWHKRAVRDPGYLPLDSEAELKILALRENERSAWADFNIKCEKNGWSESRAELGRKDLQYELDQNLALELGLGLDVGLSRDR